MRSSTSHTGAPGYPSPSPTATTQGSTHLTHQPRAPLGAPIHRSLVIEFTTIFLKSAGDMKPGEWGHRCDFSLTGVATSGFGRVPRVWPRVGFCQTRRVAIRIQSCLVGLTILSSSSGCVLFCDARIQLLVGAALSTALLEIHEFLVIS
jgi:hypothetical protein